MEGKGREGVAGRAVCLTADRGRFNFFLSFQQMNLPTLIDWIVYLLPLALLLGVFVFALRNEIAYEILAPAPADNKNTWGFLGVSS